MTISLVSDRSHRATQNLPWRGRERFVYNISRETSGFHLLVIGFFHAAPHRIVPVQYDALLTPSWLPLARDSVWERRLDIVACLPSPRIRSHGSRFRFTLVCRFRFCR